MRDVTPELLREWISYDPDSGALYWNERSPDYFTPAYHFSAEQRAKQWNVRFAGKPALTNQAARGQLQGKISCKSFYAHRVAWAIHYGEWPNGEIDHINGDPSDNRISNLRDVDRMTNAKNKPSYKNSKTNVPGVSWRERYSAYQVRISSNGNSRHIGYFKDFDEAVSARKDAERECGFHLNHGRRVSLAS